MSESITTDTTTETETGAEPVTLSIADLQNTIRVIDFAADQGAFKGWNTIEQVLIVRNRLNNFLRSVLPPETAETEAETTTETSAG